MKRILVPTAGSTSAFECADYVMTIAKSLQAEVHVLHVIANGNGEDLEIAEDAIRVFELASEEYDVGVKGFVRQGNIVEEIIKYSEDNEIALVLMGASRGEIVGQWISCDVLGHSGVPVLVMPTQVSAPIKKCAARAIFVRFLSSVSSKMPPKCFAGLGITNAMLNQAVKLNGLQSGNTKLRINSMFHVHIARIVSLTVLLMISSFVVQDLIAQQDEVKKWKSAERPQCRVPGEFEKQDGMLLAANELLNGNVNVLLDIAAHTQRRLDVLLLVTDFQQVDEIRYLLQQNRIDDRHIQFVSMPHDTMWARDYGPIVTVSEHGQSSFVDAIYSEDRVNDDETPFGLAELLGKDVRQIPLRIDGGNLLFNGGGIALTTEKFWQENAGLELDDQAIVDLMGEAYGIKNLVTLVPLVGEPTGHVDMFATFVSKNTVVVGQYDSKVDPKNTDILDYNASVLEKVRTPDGPLNVVRIPMAQRDGEVWRSYTNVIYANGVLIVPTYPDVAQPGLEHALKIYERLLPGWKVVTVDASNLIKSCGALHCISMNMGQLGKLPRLPEPFLASRQASNDFEVPINYWEDWNTSDRSVLHSTNERTGIGRADVDFFAR